MLSGNIISDSDCLFCLVFLSCFVIMFHCKFNRCDHVSDTVMQFTQHIKLHSNASNYQYQCGVPECSRKYRKFTVLKAHMYRDHRAERPLRKDCQQSDTPLKCVVKMCAVRCDMLTSFISHLKSHINEGLEIKCPFRGCDHNFTVMSSLASHVSRKHRDNGIEHLDDSILDRGVSTEPLSQSSLPIPDGSYQDGSDEPDELLAVDLQNLSLFYLKLQAKLPFRPLLRSFKMFMTLA